MFKKWLLKLIDSAREEQDKREKQVRLSNRLARMHSLRDNLELDDTVNSVGMKFTLYTAVGGHVLEAAHYNEDKDEYTYKLYMIDEEDDFAKQVAQAIMVESMKQ